MGFSGKGGCPGRFLLRECLSLVKSGAYVFFGGELKLKSESFRLNGGGACQSECLSWVAGVEAFAKYCEISSYAQTTPPEASREAWFLPGKRHLP